MLPIGLSERLPVLIELEVVQRVEGRIRFPCAGQPRVEGWPLRRKPFVILGGLREQLQRARPSRCGWWLWRRRWWWRWRVTFVGRAAIGGGCRDLAAASLGCLERSRLQVVQ